MTVVKTPPQRQPSQDELEALIEEARRRARRRHLLIVTGVVSLLLLVGAAAGAIALTRDGGAAEGLRDGFHAVQARGTVQHARLEDLSAFVKTVSLPSGAVKPTRLTREVWWNPGTGLYRTVYRYDGADVGVIVQRACFGQKPRFCLPPSPYDLRLRGQGWPPKHNRARQVGRGNFRGRPIVWVEGLVNPENGTHPLSGDQVGYDAVTHRPLVLRQILRGASGRRRVFNRTAVTILPDLAGQQVSFAVPRGGAPRNADLKVASFRKVRLDEMAKVIGRTPLWLGTSYLGHRLRFVQSGLEGGANGKNRGVGMAPVVRLDYGSFRLDEFGDERPLGFAAKLPSGKIFAENASAIFERDGVSVTVLGSLNGPLSPADATALVKALRPVPAG